MFGSTDVAPTAGEAGAASTTPAGAGGAGLRAWAIDADARVHAKVKAAVVTRAIVVLGLFDMPGRNCSRRADAQTRRNARKPLACATAARSSAVERGDHAMLKIRR